MTITNCQSGLYYFWDDKLQRKKKARKQWRKQERKRQYERQSRARPANIFQSLNTEMWSTDSMACKQLAFIYSSTLPLGQLHRPVKFDAFSNSSYWKDIRSFQNSLKKPHLSLTSVLLHYFCYPSHTTLLTPGNYLQNCQHLLSQAGHTCYESPEENSAAHAFSGSKRKANHTLGDRRLNFYICRILKSFYNL